MKIPEKYSKYIQSKHLGCIEAMRLSDDVWEFNAALLSKIKNKINIDKVSYSIDNIDSIDFIIKKVPVCLVLTGKGIMYKKIEINTTNTNDEQLLQTLLPNASLDDFYIQKQFVSANEWYVAVIRKKQLENMVQWFIERKIFLLEIFLGPFCLIPVLQLIKPLPQEIEAGNFLFSLKNEIVYDINTNEKPSRNNIYLLGNEQVHANVLIPVSAGITHLLFPYNKPSPTFDITEKNQSDYAFSRLFKILGIGLLVFFFAILLLNYFFFDSLNKKQQKLQIQLSSYSNIIACNDSLKKEVEQKKQLLDETGILVNTRLSYYADRLAASLPDGIILTEMNINPVDEKQLKNAKLEIIKNNIQIHGLLHKSTLLNEWIEKIGEFEWVKEVILLDFYRLQNDQPANFSIDIIIK